MATIARNIAYRSVSEWHTWEVPLRYSYSSRLPRDRRVDRIHGMVRTVSILLVVWSLTATRSLCIAGVLHHPCHHGPEADHQHEDPCSHEQSCSQDRCSMVAVARRDRPVGDSDSKPIHPGQAVPVFIALVWAESQTLQPSADHLRLALLRPLPFPSSDIPLLI